eukprot:TRINITY_DN243_c0_g1_i1.p1 TRINITY_DN243_c0_g1~~TRINITY_DN243_c0_g1_i1.p1  ORF type:complete len:189 (-),score=28.33 TRINITY_DN243_c0_g1_i1:132-698(-)
MGFTDPPSKSQPLAEETIPGVEHEPTVTIKIAHINYLLLFLIFGFGCAVFVMNTTMLSLGAYDEIVAPILDVVFCVAIIMTCLSGCLYSKFYKTKPCLLYFYGFSAAGTLLFLVAVIIVQLVSSINPHLLSCKRWYCYSHTQPIIGYVTFSFFVTIGVLVIITTGTILKLRRKLGLYSTCPSTDSSSC